MRTIQLGALFTVAMTLCSIEASAQELSRDVLLDFVNTRYHAYFHYNMCTFKNLDSEQRHGRTHGDDPPTRWRPSGLDCEQWARVCKDAKMAGGWLTTKHHGGFCLWDSEHTDYDVASSNVKTDVVKVFTDTFREAGLKIGLYYSILDYHHGIENGSVTREEIEFLKAQITELLTNYGPIDYILTQLHSYNSHNSVYVLNLSPGPDGRIPQDAVKRVADVASSWNRPAPLAKAGDNWGFQYDVVKSLAFLRPCSQSSTHQYLRDKRAYPRAEIAVDGVTEGDGMMEQTSITLEEDSPWWQVDLERDCRIKDIQIYGRTDVDSSSKQQLDLSITTADGADAWSGTATLTPAGPVTIDVVSAVGRKVHVRLRGTGTLAIAEVIVKGSDEK